MQPIGESELIITNKGTTYHLDLRPDQLADTVITVGDPNRVASVSQYFDSIEHKAQHREFISHTGYIGNKRLTVVGSGIGTDNIDIALNELDALVNIDFNTRLPKEQTKSLTIIRMGTCGSLQADVPVDSLVVSTHGIGLDNVLHYYSHTTPPQDRDLLYEFEQHTDLHNRVITPYIAEGAPELRNHFKDGYVHGITITCPGFYGPQGRILRVALAFPALTERLSSFRSGTYRITNFEMETSAIYGLGRLLGHRCMSINTVVANRIQRTFSADAGAAIDHMIRRSLQIIAGL